MRKFVLFVLLFGSGLAVLLTVKNCTQRSAVEAPPSRETPLDRDEFTEIPLADEAEERQRPLREREHTAIGVLPDGPMEITQFAGEGETRKRERVLRWEDVDPAGTNVYEVKNLEVTIHDLETGDVAARLRSPKTRLRISFVDGKPTIGEGDRVVLSQVELELLRGAPVTPVTLRVPRLEWLLDQGEFVSDDHVELTGAGFEAEGTGLRADMHTETIRLERQGLIQLATETTASAILAADGDGPIVVTKGASAEGTSIDVSATGGARFAITGEEPLQVEATEIHIAGKSAANDRKGFALSAADARGNVVSQSRGDTFRAQSASFVFGERGVLARAELEGNVVLQGGDNTFRADRAAFDFGPGGRLATAKLEGTPSASVGVGRFAPAKEVELRAATAELAGAGPLWIDFGERTEMRLAGPGEVRVPELDFELRASEELRGSVDARDKSGELVARGAAHVRYQEQEMDTDVLALTFTTAATGERQVAGRTEGRTAVRGQSEGEHFALVAEGGLEVRSQGRGLVVSLARQVDIEVEGERSFHARADVVRELDVSAATFVAEGAVEFRDARYSVRAPEVRLEGRDSLKLLGRPSEPARMQMVPEPGGAAVAGDVEAAEIHLTLGADDVFDAHGDSKATVAMSEATYELSSESLHVVRRHATTPPARAFEARATGRVRARATSAEGEIGLACEELDVEGDLPPREGESAPPAAPSRLRAARGVELEYARGTTVRARGDLLVLEGTTRARLSADPGGRVRAVGRIDPTRPPYALTADWIELVDGRVQASMMQVDLEPEAEGAQQEARAAPGLSNLRADVLTADEREVRLSGHAHADGVSKQGEVWSVDAGSMRIEGDFRDQSSLSVDVLSLAEAWDGFRLAIGDRVTAEGDRLSGRVGQIRLEGHPAKLATASTVWESAWIEYDMTNMLLATDKGVLLPAVGSSGSPWSVTYESMQPFDRGDTTILALRNPVFRESVRELRADWVLLWIDREEWRTSGQRALSESSQGPDLRVTAPAPAPQAAPKTGMDLFGRYRRNELARVLSEAYFEGSIELLENNERVARSSAVYLDFKEGRGWVEDADVLMDVNIRGEPRRLRAKSKWMRVGAEGSLRADRAVITSCDHDEPHYVVETGDLRLTRNSAGALGWNVSARKNAIRFGELFAIPLPPLVYETDKKGNPLIESFILGNSSKFGAQVGASFNFTLGKVGVGIGKVFGTLLDLPETNLDGHWKFDARYLGSRGLLLGVGLELEVPEQFKLDLAIDGIPDGQDDKGLIRVPTDDRSTLRDWFRARGRYVPDKADQDEWFDLALSLQSDPGVQSEFFEDEFLEYEQKDNYVHWRKARDEYYFDSSVKVVLEDRTDVEELPSLGAFRGRTPIAELGSNPLLYTARAAADYSRRVEGDPDYYAPFADGLGERDVGRFDTEHQLEVPIPLGFANARATPFVRGRATAWSEGADPDASPTFAGLFAGLELGTTLWKRFSNGSFHTVAPTVGVRADVATSESDGAPVPIDRTEEPVEGTVFDVGFLSRWWVPDAPQRFDLDVRAGHAADLADEDDDGLLPVAVLSELLISVADVPVGFTHDGRYDVEDGNTPYSRSFVGFEPMPKLGIELGYHRGLDDLDVLLYEAASLELRYRATNKWELELEQTVSLFDDSRLSNNFVLRRLGHDFVTEIDVSYRAGEGSSFGIKVVPLLSWKRSRLGLIDRWLGTRRY